MSNHQHLGTEFNNEVDTNVPKNKKGFSARFQKIAAVVTKATGSSTAFLVAAAVIIIWGITGPIFKFSDTWQLVINTSTTIITFLMVFLIQNTQNRDAKAIHLKLDELIKGVSGARTKLVDLEELSDEELEELQAEFKRIHQREAKQLEKAASRTKKK